MKHPVISLGTYLGYFGLLLALSGLQVYLSFQNLGTWNAVAAVSIASLQALLVAMIFMHLKWSARILWVFAASGAVWFVIMIALLLSDYHSRNWQANPHTWEPVRPALPEAPAP